MYTSAKIKDFLNQPFCPLHAVSSNLILWANMGEKSTNRVVACVSVYHWNLYHNYFYENMKWLASCRNHSPSSCSILRNSYQLLLRYGSGWTDRWRGRWMDGHTKPITTFTTGIGPVVNKKDKLSNWNLVKSDTYIYT